MGYYRALVKNNEKSKRALDLTNEIIKHNPAHYTVWFVLVWCWGSTLDQYSFGIIVIERFN